jgi:hypothetical protein
VINGVSCSTQIHGLLVDFFAPPYQEREHVSTRRFVAVTKGHDAADLTKAKPDDWLARMKRNRSTTSDS